MKITFDNTTLDLTPNGKSHRVTIGVDVYDVELIRVDEESGRLDLRLIRASVSPSVDNHPPSVSNPLTTSVPIRESVTESVDESFFTAYVSSDGAKRWVTINGQTSMLTKQSGARRSGGGHHHAAGALRVTAPMPGQVRAVNVSEGEAVVKGQTLMILEAMKMEIRIQATQAGVVSKIFVKQGQTVEREQVLVIVESQTSNV